MFIPGKVDLTPNGKIVKRAGFGEEGYGPNFECTLLLSHSDEGVYILYYSEDDSYLDDAQVEYIIKNAHKLT